MINDLNELVFSDPNISMLCKSWCVMKMRGIDDKVNRQVLSVHSNVRDSRHRWDDILQIETNDEWSYKKVYGYDKDIITHDEASKMWVECLRLWFDLVYCNEEYHVRTVTFQEGFEEVGIFCSRDGTTLK